MHKPEILFFTNCPYLLQIPDSCWLFANDFKAAKRVSGLCDCLALQEVINRREIWCELNGMSLNVSKCYDITFH